MDSDSDSELHPGILALVKLLARQAVREFLRSQSAAAAAGENSVQIASFQSEPAPARVSRLQPDQSTHAHGGVPPL
jgi:hypothetical protein